MAQSIKVKQIKTDDSNSKFLQIKNGFNKRWNIKDENENKTHLKNRCLSVICNYLNNIRIYDKRKEIIDDFCYEIEMALGFPVNENRWDTFDSTKLYKRLELLDLNDNDSYNLFMYFLEIMLNHKYSYYDDNDKLAKKISEVLKLSNANVMLCKNGNIYELYPLGTEFLNDKLIVDVLSWLNEYPKTKKSFSKAIKMKRTEENYRNIIDELRLSIELLFKQLFNNEKSLENQSSNIGNYFKENNISTYISNMYIKLIDLYTKYNNNNAKHNDNVVEIEIDYIIYLTGSFIRFILLIEKTKQQI